MTEWDFFDDSILRKKINPVTLTTKSGLPVYDLSRINPMPEYHSVVVVTREIQREMFYAGINGGYSLVPKTNEKNSFIVTPKTEQDFEKAKRFPIQAYKVFSMANYPKRSVSVYANEFPEIEGFLEGQLKNLLTMIEKGATFNDIATIAKVNQHDLVKLYYRLKR